MDSGVNISGGLAIGATLGAGIGVAWFRGEAEGEGKSIDANLKFFSASIFFDDQGFKRLGSISRAQEFGAIAGTLTGSGTLSAKMVVNAIEKIADRVSDWFSQ